MKQIFQCQTVMADSVGIFQAPSKSALTVTTTPERPPERSFMPLQHTTSVASQPLESTKHQPSESTLRTGHLFSMTSPPGIFHSSGLDPGASTSGEYYQRDDMRDFPSSSTSAPSSSHESLGAIRHSRAEDSFQTPAVTSTGAASSPAPQAGSPNSRLTTEGTPINNQATSVSTMTPPMSPPKMKGLFASSSSTKVSRPDIPHSQDNQSVLFYMIKRKLKYSTCSVDVIYNDFRSQSCSDISQKSISVFSADEALFQL